MKTTLLKRKVICSRHLTISIDINCQLYRPKYFFLPHIKKPVYTTLVCFVIKIIASELPRAHPLRHRVINYNMILPARLAVCLLCVNWCSLYELYIILEENLNVKVQTPLWFLHWSHLRFSVSIRLEQRVHNNYSSLLDKGARASVSCFEIKGFQNKIQLVFLNCSGV